MTSRVPIALTASIAAFAAVAGLAVPATGTTKPSETDGSVELLDCTHGKRSADRNALFRGAMGQIPAGESMRMRFELFERVGHGAWSPVEAPGLELWRYARPGFARFAYRQRIAALQPGTAYRVRVTFQWHDAAGRLLERQVARSPICRQGGALPNLRVGSLDQLPGPTADTRRYLVWVLNKGTVPAQRVAVSLLVDGAEVDTRGMGNVARRGRRQIAFVGPACTGAVTVELDPSDKLRELDESDNERSFTCAG